MNHREFRDEFKLAEVTATFKKIIQQNQKTIAL